MRAVEPRTSHEYIGKVSRAPATGNQAANTLCDAETRSLVTELPYTRVNRRRQVSHQSGKALEALGHAIEYLADEYAFHGGVFAVVSPEDPQVQAIQILMAANRSVYCECPIAANVWERFRAFVLRSILIAWKDIQRVETRVR
jgi:hypothetical protein